MSKGCCRRRPWCYVIFDDTQCGGCSQRISKVEIPRVGRFIACERLRRSRSSHQSMGCSQPSRQFLMESVRSEQYERSERSPPKVRQERLLANGRPVVRVAFNEAQTRQTKRPGNSHSPLMPPIGDGREGGGSGLCAGIRLLQSLRSVKTLPPSVMTETR